MKIFSKTIKQEFRKLNDLFPIFLKDGFYKLNYFFIYIDNMFKIRLLCFT